MRWFLVLGTAVLAQACVNHTELARQSVESTVLHSNEISYRELESFPGNVVCGEFSTRRRPKDESYLPFIYRSEKVDVYPSREDISIFCSADPAKSLHGVYGINFSGSDKATLLVIRADYVRLGTALEQYEVDNFMLPRSEQGLDALLHASKSMPVPRRFREGGYLSTLPLDPWNIPYIYSASAMAGVKGSYQLLTLGADGIEGGIDENADVSSQHMKYINHIENL